MKKSPTQRPLTIALNRGGRILEECLSLLAQAGVEPAEQIDGSRKLVFAARTGERLVVVRGDDVPTYVEYGAADVGITGKDTLLEHGGGGFYERLDLKIAPCRIMTAAPIGAALGKNGPLRVATKFVNTSKRYFAEQGRQVEIIRLTGAMEIAPLMGLADCIVDIVETGNTLVANGLEAREVIANVSARVIVNRAAQKMRFEEIEALLERLAAAVATR
jgi:ATP phosphoribosyltransferase